MAHRNKPDLNLLKLDKILFIFQPGNAADVTADFQVTIASKIVPKPRNPWALFKKCIIPVVIN